MGYKASKVNYCYITATNRAGSAAAILNQLKAARINLLAFSGFPGKAGKAQIDLVAGRVNQIQKLAKKNGWKVSKAKKGFLIQGTDQTGAIAGPLSRLAKAKVNVTAADAVAAGKKRYGMVLWVKARDFNRAAKALKAH